jgi:hypothetical protein
MMRNQQSPRYEAVATNNQATPEPGYSNSTVSNESKSLAPQRLDSSWGPKIFRGCLDVVISAVAVLFIVFGFLVFKNDGKPPYPGSEAAFVVQVAQYVCIFPSIFPLIQADWFWKQGPTVFSILFAAIVGGAMKSIATWRIQRGTTVGFVEQLLGSNSISGVLVTQVASFQCPRPLYCCSLVSIAIGQSGITACSLRSTKLSK